MEESLEDINNWTPGKTVLLSVSKPEVIGKIAKHFSNSVGRQRLCASSPDKTTLVEFQSQNLSRTPSTDDLPDDLPEKKEQTCESSELPPGLADEILSLREDFEIKDGSPQKMELSGTAGTENWKRQRKTFLQLVAESKTFDEVDTLNSTDLGMRQAKSHVGVQPNVDGLCINQSTKLVTERQGREVSLKLLKDYFANIGKEFEPLSREMVCCTSNTNTVSVSELKLAANQVGMKDKIIFFNKDILKLTTIAKPSSFELSGHVKPDQKTETLLQSKENKMKAPMIGNVPGQGHPCIQQLEHKLDPSPQRLIRAEFLSPENAYKGFSRSVSGCGNASVSPAQYVPGLSGPSTSREPEPPDLSHYACSEELKQALRINLSAKNSSQGSPCQRFHPYQRTEARYQMTLPNLAEFK